MIRTMYPFTLETDFPGIRQQIKVCEKYTSNNLYIQATPLTTNIP